MADTAHTTPIDISAMSCGIYSAVLDANNNNKFVRFKYRSGEMTYGNEMQDVMPNVFNDRYTSAIYNPIENLMVLDVNIKLLNNKLRTH